MPLIAFEFTSRVLAGKKKKLTFLSDRKFFQNIIAEEKIFSHNTYCQVNA